MISIISEVNGNARLCGNVVMQQGEMFPAAEIDRLERAPIRSIEYREYDDLGPKVLRVAALMLAVYALGSTTWAFRVP